MNREKKRTSWKQGRKAMRKPKGPVVITITISHPQNRMYVAKGVSLRGGKWVDRISAFYIRRQVESNLFNFGFSNPKMGKVVDIILNGRHVVLEEISSRGTAKFTVRP